MNNSTLLAIAPFLFLLFVILVCCAAVIYNNNKDDEYIEKVNIGASTVSSLSGSKEPKVNEADLYKHKIVVTMKNGDHYNLVLDDYFDCFAFGRVGRAYIHFLERNTGYFEACENVFCKIEDIERVSLIDKYKYKTVRYTCTTRGQVEIIEEKECL